MLVVCRICLGKKKIIFGKLAQFVFFFKKKQIIQSLGFVARNGINWGCLFLWFNLFFKGFLNCFFPLEKYKIDAFEGFFFL